MINHTTDIRIDYKKELETASKGMILIHDHMLLIKLLVRMIVRKVRVSHAGMIILDADQKNYVLAVSRGATGERIPENYLKFSPQHPLIRLFQEKQYQYIVANRNAILVDDINRLIWKESLLEGSNGTRELLHQVSEHLPMLNSVACVPALYRDKLLALLLLGQKQDHEKFEQEELDFFSALASDVAMAIRNAQLFEELKAEAERSRNLFIQTTIALGSAIEAKDPYTHGHTERVTKYSLAIARQMVEKERIEVPEKFYENLYIAGLLHDIGKIGIPESILMKKDKLTNEEFSIMKTHAARGAEILSPIKDFNGCIEGVKYHHERYDGTGYPEGLKADTIPLIASIIAVADTFDAMTTDRPYRKGLTKEFSVNEIKSLSEKMFHPHPVKALVTLYEKGLI